MIEPLPRPDSTALAANARNNAQHQRLRLARWTDVRDQLWRILEPRVHDGARVALVGGGSCDDLPIRRIVAAGASVELIDIDADAAERGRRRVARRNRAAVRISVGDVTDGAADAVVASVAEQRLLTATPPLATGPLGDEPYDLVVGDMLYTQLLHPALVATGRPVPEQAAAMRRFDGPLVEALVRRLHASVRPGGSVVHIDDVACWSAHHPQPMPLAEALQDPAAAWARLKRHDACDPALAVERLRLGRPAVTAWWDWPFEPNKHFLVRCIAVDARGDATNG